MATKTGSELDVKLAVYMERLDSYIESQTRLNDTLCARFEEMGEELDEIKHWRAKIYGVKSAFVIISVIAMHTGMVLGSLFAMMTWFSKSQEWFMNSEHFPEAWPSWEIDPSTRTSVHVWTKYAPIDVSVGTSAVDLFTVETSF